MDIKLMQIIEWDEELLGLDTNGKIWIGKICNNLEIMWEETNNLFLYKKQTSKAKSKTVGKR